MGELEGSIEKMETGDSLNLSNDSVIYGHTFCNTDGRYVVRVIDIMAELQSMKVENMKTFLEVGESFLKNLLIKLKS